MTRAPYRRYLIVTLAAAGVLAAFLWLITPSRWFGFYGLASVVLAAAVPLTYLLWVRLETIDWHRAWTLVFTAPALALALVQIGFWTAFFSYGVTNPTFGIVRSMVQLNLGPYFPLLGLVLAVVWSWLFWRTAAELP